MQIRRRAAEIEILAPAKVNLFFEVLSRRGDGYHEIETLMLPIGLYDTLILEDEPSGQVAISARWATGGRKQLGESVVDAQWAGNTANTIPQGDENHAVRAVRLLAEEAKIRRGAKLRLVKRIPLAAGLGGGSSDAAAALVAANFAWKLNWSVPQLAKVAVKIGSDVPFFLVSTAAICRGRGEQIERISGIGIWHLVVVKPPEGLSTPLVYQACCPGQPPESVKPFIESLRTGGIGHIGPLLHNRLLEPARRLSIWIDRVLSCLAAEGCPAIGMSGSGTSCFAVCRSALQAKRLAARWRQQWPEIGSIWAVDSL